MQHISFVAPPTSNIFFKQPKFLCLLGQDFSQVSGFAATALHLVNIYGTGRVANMPPLPSFHEVYKTVFATNDLSGPFTSAQLSDATLATQPVQHDPDLLF